MISEIYLSARIQSDNFYDFIKRLNIQYENDYSLKTNNINFLRNFNKISFETFYNSFFKGIENTCNNKRLKAFNKAFYLIDSLTKYNSSYKQELLEFNNKFKQHENKWNLTVENVRLMYESILLSIDGSKLPRNEGEFFTKIDKIITDWQIINNRTDYFTAYTKLICPLLSLCRVKENQEYIKKIKPLVDKLAESEYHYINMKRVFEIYYIIFYDTGFQFRYISRMLKQINKILK